VPFSLEQESNRLAASARWKNTGGNAIFRVTGEPAPGAASKRTKQLAYLIQKHAATRLHFDFRFEFDGVLLSLAVTKRTKLKSWRLVL
jgi:hypothetical protein